MDDLYGKVEVFPEHFQPSKESDESCSSVARNSSADPSLRSQNNSWAVRRVMGAASLLNLLSLPRFRWPNTADEDDKVVLTKAEVESLRSEIADAEERETLLRAQLENIDEVLRSARLFGYLYIRTRWTELPGEPPILDDSDVDDWLPRFEPSRHDIFVDITEIGPLPSVSHEDNQTRYAFYILTSQGLRYECSTMSEIQVESWLRALRTYCKLKGDTIPNSSVKSYKN